jgi:hypothetical protein
MTNIDFGQTINTLANIGVIAGIVFLAIEVRQNQASLNESNRISQRALEISSLERFSAIRDQIAESEEMAQIWTKGLADEDLTAIDEIRFRQMCTNRLYATGVMIKHFSESGSADYAFWAESEANQIAGSQRMRTCWDTIMGMREFSNDVFVDAIEARLREIDETSR